MPDRKRSFGRPDAAMVARHPGIAGEPDQHRRRARRAGLTRLDHLMPAPASCAFGSVDATLPDGHIDHRHATGVNSSRQPALSAPENTSSEAAAMSGAR